MSWQVSGPSPNLALDGITLKHFTAEKKIKAACREQFLQKLQGKKSQGIVSCCGADSQISHHFMQKADYIRFADWRSTARD